MDATPSPRRSHDNDVSSALPGSSSKQTLQDEIIAMPPRRGASRSVSRSMTPSTRSDDDLDSQASSSRMQVNKSTCNTLPRDEIPPILKGSTGYFVPDDFEDEFVEKLERDFESLGGTVVDTLEQATFIIFYPPIVKDAEWYERLLARTQNIKALDEPMPAVRPYTWIYESMYRYPRPRLLRGDECKQQPSFQQWDSEIKHLRPLKVYISVNLPRYNDEPTAQDMIAVITRMLESGGAVVSPTRKHADILLLNTDTPAGQKLEAEKLAHQTVHNREYIEEILFNERCLTRGDGAMQRWIQQQRQEKLATQPGRPWLSKETAAGARAVKK